VLRRAWILLGARRTSARRGGSLAPSLVFLATLATVLTLLVRDALPAYPYWLFALGTGAGVLALPLLGDLGALLRQDEGAEWLLAQPIREREWVLARCAQGLGLLAALGLAWFGPFAALAPEGSVLERGGLLVLGFVELIGLAAALFWCQQLLIGRFTGLLIAIETALVILVVVGLVRWLGSLPELAQLEPGQEGGGWLPPAWGARALARGGWAWGAPAVLGGVAILLLLLLPPSGPRARRRGSLERWMTPLHALAVRGWVRRAERGPFELVYRALPREREVTLRTLPMLGIPLAFLWVGASERPGEDLAWRSDVLALLLFTAPVYLPLLLTHVPLSESSDARWMLASAPVSRSDVEEGAIKALFVRWLLPLYLALLGLGVFLGQAALLLRLWLPATLLGLVLLRLLYGRCVRDLPLSTPPAELRGDVDWAGLMIPLAVGLTLLAVVANRTFGWGSSLALWGLLGGVELLLERRRTPGRAPGGLESPLPGSPESPG